MTATTTTVEQLARAVMHSDFYLDEDCPSGIEKALEIALKKIAIASPVRINLGNGHFLNCELDGAPPMLRPELLAFAMRMEQRLREKHADKGESWRGMYPDHLMVQASSKAIRLESLILSDAKPADYLRHAVDLANYCLMIASLAKVDDASPEYSGPGWFGIDQAPVWQRNDEATYHTLLLVSGHAVTPDVIASWSDEQCQQAEQWAMAIHLQASDNDGVEVPRTPECVRPFLVR